MAEGTLHLGRDSERRGARFGESDGYQRSCAGFDGNERGAADLADSRDDRLRRVPDKDESIDDLFAIGLLAVVDPFAAGRIEVEIGQAALGGREKHQRAQQDCEMGPLAPMATCIFHTGQLSCTTPANRANLVISMAWNGFLAGITTGNDARRQGDRQSSSPTLALWSCRDAVGRLGGAPPCESVQRFNG
jgi:hypothetical protein